MSEPCTLAIRRSESGYLVRVVGRGTMHASPAVQDFICNVVEDGADVVLDLSACEYLDSTFLGCSVMLHQRASRATGSFAVHACEDDRRKLLGVMRLQDILTFVDARPECSGDSVTLSITDVERSEFCQHLLETHRRLAELGGPAAPKFRAVAAQMAKDLGNLS